MLVAVTPEIFIQGCPITYGNDEVHFYLAANDLQVKNGSERLWNLQVFHKEIQSRPYNLALKYDNLIAAGWKWAD